MIVMKVVLLILAIDGSVILFSRHVDDTQLSMIWVEKATTQELVRSLDLVDWGSSERRIGPEQQRSQSKLKDRHEGDGREQ